MEQVTADHEEQSARMREVLRTSLASLVEKIDDQLDVDPTAGMVMAKIAALRELGRLYQTSERPGQTGKLTELQVSKLLEAERARTRLEVLEELKQSRQNSLESGSRGVRESLLELSDKSLS